MDECTKHPPKTRPPVKRVRPLILDAKLVGASVPPKRVKHEDIFLWYEVVNEM